MNFICEMCEKPIEGQDIEERHDMHRGGCPNRGGCSKDGDHGCDCDMSVHAECCPDCKPKLLFEWEIPKEIQDQIRNCLDTSPEAYRVFEHTEAVGGCLIEARYSGKWQRLFNPGNTRMLVKELVERLDVLQPSRGECCTWTRDACDAWYYSPSCGGGRDFTFNDGGPRQNGFLFCPYCGLPVVEVGSR